MGQHRPTQSLRKKGAQFEEENMTLLVCDCEGLWPSMWRGTRQVRPTQVTTGQHMPTQANTGHHRPTQANTGQECTPPTRLAPKWPKCVLEVQYFRIEVEGSFLGNSRRNAEPTQCQHRGNAGPTQSQYRPTQSQHRANTGPTQANTGPTQSQHRANTGPTQANTGPTQSQHR